MVISDILLKYYNKEVKQISKIEIGLINQTFKTTTTSGNYIFQKINCEVFKNYTAIVNNENELRDLLPVTPLSEKSIALGSQSVDFPDF